MANLYPDSGEQGWNSAVNQNYWNYMQAWQQQMLQQQIQQQPKQQPVVQETTSAQQTTSHSDKAHNINEAENSESEEEIEDKDTYKQKMWLAHSVLGTEPPKKNEEESDLRLEEIDKQQNGFVFPIQKTIQNAFINSWKNIIGNKSYVNTFSLTPPNKPVRVGTFKASKKGKRRNKWYKIEGEEEDSLPTDRWPFGIRNIDSDFMSTFGKTASKSSTLNFWMEERGKINKILNQMVFFTKACNTIIKADFEQHVKETGFNSWKAMRGFLDIKGQSIEDIINISTNLMGDMLVKRREEILKPLALPEIE